MADTTVTLNAGAGGEDVAGDDDVTTGFHQYVKLKFGGSGTYTHVTASAGLPVTPDSGGFDVTNAGTFAVQVDGAALTALQLIDDAVYTDATGTPSKGLAVMGTDGTNPQIISVDTSGNVQVDLVTADVTNAGTFAVQEDGAALTALQLIDDVILAQDAAASSAKVAMAGAIRDDALTTLTPIDGDAVALRVGSTGALWVDINSVPAGSAEIVDDAAFTPASTSVVMMGFEYDDTTPDSVDEGDGGAARMSANRNIYMQIRDAAGNERGVNVDASNQLLVSEANSAAILADTAAMDTNLATLAGAVFADDAAFTLASSNVMVGGAIRDDSLSTLTAIEGDAVPLRVSSTGALHVTGGGGGTQYSIDDAGPTVVTMAGVVRDDSLTTLTEIDGDATVLRVNSTGALHVTGGGGGTEYAVDDALGATPTGSLAIAIRDDALSALTPVEGDAIGLRVGSTGALWIEDVNSAAILADTAAMDTNLASLAGTVGGTELQVDVVGALPAGSNAIGKLAANSGVDIGDVDVTSIVPGTGATNLGKAEDAAHTTGDTGVMSLAVQTATPANKAGTEGDYEPLQISAGRLWTSTTVTSLPASTNTIEVVGDAAENAAVAGNPVLTGGRYDSSARTLGNGDVGAIAVNAAGETIVQHNTTNLADGVTTVTTAGTDVVLASSTAAKWVVIQAQTDNTGVIAVGNSGVDATVATGTGVALAAGESITIPCDNLNDIYIDSTVNGEGVRYTYGT